MESLMFNFLLLGSVFSGLVMFGLLFYLWQSRNEANARAEVRGRLDISKTSRGSGKATKGSVKAAGAVAKKVIKSTDTFYSNSDPKQRRKLRTRLIQAGYVNENAVAYFFVMRFAMAFAGLLFSLCYIFLIASDMSFNSKTMMVMAMTLGGYFLPNFHIEQRFKARQLENRAGFPDVMDLMVVAAEAGLTTEASIERIALEIRHTYPALSEQLTLAAIEIRAGRPLDEALRAFGERVGLDEVQGFATMIQQSKELGTSVSNALRVYSDEMRHKRMMAAEEKAYALPAKLSIPVTVFILPIVIGVAIIPSIIRLGS